MLAYYLSPRYNEPDSKLDQRLCPQPGTISEEPLVLGIVWLQKATAPGRVLVAE